MTNANKAQRWWLLWLSVGIWIVATSSCKETDFKDDNSQNQDIIVARVSPERYADSTREIGRGSDFFFKIFDESFTAVLADLPRSGETPADRRPYSGHWYPERFGGVDVRVGNSRSPLQKYDDAFNNGSDKASAWERANHTVAANDPSASWAGHCNGFAAAAQRHAEPTTNVTKDGVTFSPQDIKGLLAEIYMSAKFFFLGGNRCELEGRLPGPQNRQDPEVMDACEDINPGTLHANIANWIGKKRHALIIDQSSNYQVWNYPLYKYEVLALGEVSQARALQEIGAGGGTTYKFNRNAVKFFSVRTRLTYANALEREAINTHQPGFFDLTYILETNAAGEIIGGEWTGQSQANHPDFLWIAFEPVQGDGSRYFGNPHVDPAVVIRLWAESAGFDPDDPPLDILEPQSIEEWGRFPNFDVTIDGNARGVVFAGKPTNLAITRRGDLREDITLSIEVDGDSVNDSTIGAGSAYEKQFATGLGLHRISFDWKKGSESVDKRSLYFVVVP